MPRTELKEAILGLLKEESVCVIASCDRELNKPRATPCHYHVDDDMNIYILSDNNTQKLFNIENNNQVSIAVCSHKSYDPHDRSFSNCKGLQIEGLGKIESSDDFEMKDQLHQWVCIYWLFHVSYFLILLFIFIYFSFYHYCYYCSQ